MRRRGVAQLLIWGDYVNFESSTVSLGSQGRSKNGILGPNDVAGINFVGFCLAKRYFTAESCRWLRFFCTPEPYCSLTVSVFAVTCASFPCGKLKFSVSIIHGAWKPQGRCGSTCQDRKPRHFTLAAERGAEKNRSPRAAIVHLFVDRRAARLRYFPVGTRRLSSSNQFCTRIISVTG